jgi:hypothetical protein
MKFAMNGCLLLAARGGSNDEIQQEIGDENIVKFLSTPINIKFVAYDVIIGSWCLWLDQHLSRAGCSAVFHMVNYPNVWSLQFIFGAKADELGRLRAERRKFNPPRDFHRVIG